MIDPELVIREINKKCQLFFPISTFFMNRKGTHFISSGSNTSKAINNHNNYREEINVIKWFDDIWIYFSIKFEKSQSNMPNVFISISFFQGAVDDDIKIQLFRAEWDNFDNNLIHPQPHWHIYPIDNFEKTYYEFADVIDEDGSFADIIDKKKAKTINIKKIHFAMNGDWSNNNSHIHNIIDEHTIINWILGLLGHIKSQFEFLQN